MLALWDLHGGLTMICRRVAAGFELEGDLAEMGALRAELDDALKHAGGHVRVDDAPLPRVTVFVADGVAGVARWPLGDAMRRRVGWHPDRHRRFWAMLVGLSGRGRDA